MIQIQLRLLIAKVRQVTWRLVEETVLLLLLYRMEHQLQLDTFNSREEQPTQ